MLTPEAVTTVAAYVFGVLCGAGGLAVVVRYGEPEPGRHRAGPASHTPADADATDSVVPPAQEWAAARERVDPHLPPVEAAVDAARTPADERVRIGGHVTDTAQTTPLPAAGPPPEVSGALVLEYREGAS